jgi:glycine dehydrogenase subunit 2
MEKLLNELSINGRRAYRFPDLDVEAHKAIDPSLLRQGSLDLPQMAEVDVVRHYARLSRLAYGVDDGFYPLGSCTMKYNPKLNEALSHLEGFTELHPLADAEHSQGSLKILYETVDMLCKVTGMDQGTLQPCAGAHGEYTGLKLIRAYHLRRNDSKRSVMLIPSSAHGTNPASASVNGFETVAVASDERGLVDLKDLESKLSDNVAGIMLTNPNTLGLFELDIRRIADMVHACGGLLYYDGANMNAIMGFGRPGDMGFDVMHLNLHKTFSTPHGGGGPGSGAVLVKQALAPFLPVPVAAKGPKGYSLDWDRPQSIGKVSGFWGNFLVIVRAYAYLLSMGSDGLREASAMATINANYMARCISAFFPIAYPGLCKHEFVLSLAAFKEETGCSALDVAKALLDKGYHPPTMYFPSLVHEALMIEPTETESRETLDGFIEALKCIHDKAYSNPEELHSSPATTVIGRPDEAEAAKRAKVNWL